MIAFLTDDLSIRVVAGMNAALAALAAGVHSWAALKTSGLIRKMFIGICSLAVFYCAAYVWLFFNYTRSGEWSDFLRPFGLLTWVIAWAIEPFILVTYLQRRGQEIVKKAEVAASKADDALNGHDE